jgi:hypothetical protein
MSCGLQQQIQQQGGAGAAEYVEQHYGVAGQQNAVSNTDNYIAFKGGRRRRRVSRRQKLLSRIMGIVKRRSSRRTRRHKRGHRSCRRGGC